MIRVILTDIEGTTSSISFVHEVLFPYAKRELRAFVEANAHEPVVQEQLKLAQVLAACDNTVDATVEALLGWIDEDRKATPLKALQGLIWEAGYQSGELKGHLYEDAHACLRGWYEAGMRLYVFSSGSIQAQKLLFGYSDYGDLAPLFSGNFDTTIGNKKDADAYVRIAEAIGVPSESILFLSDVGAELDAARASGMATVQLVRDEGIVPAPGHPQVAGFNEIDLSTLS
ncbi:MAG: acireductone synthase [Myxococcota bacterium]|nr:acireductone synthase [Myxococcota bacterium]